TRMIIAMMAFRTNLQIGPTGMTSSKVLADAEVDLPIRTARRLVERNPQVEAQWANWRFVAKRGACTKAQVVDRDVVGVCRELSEIQKSRAVQLFPKLVTELGRAFDPG